MCVCVKEVQRTRSKIDLAMVKPPGDCIAPSRESRTSCPTWAVSGDPSGLRTISISSKWALEKSRLFCVDGLWKHLETIGNNWKQVKTSGNLVLRWFKAMNYGGKSCMSRWNNSREALKKMMALEEEIRFFSTAFFGQNSIDFLRRERFFQEDPGNSTRNPGVSLMRMG